MTICRCPECLAGDALPERLQGIPGARQEAMFEGEVLMAMSRDEALRDACSERCAGFGDPSCWSLEGSGPVSEPFRWTPCAECLVDVDGEAPDALDPGAVVAPLL